MKNKELMLQLINEKIDYWDKMLEKTNEALKHHEEGLKKVEEENLKELYGATTDDFKRFIKKDKEIIEKRKNSIEQLEELRGEVETL